MNALHKYRGAAWDPFKEMEDLQRQVSSLMGLTPVNRTAANQEDITLAQWAPKVDIAEDDQAYVIKAELPEVNREEVHVTVENGVLTLRGERKLEQEETKKKYHRVERSYGSFVRSFSIPEDANPEKITANYKDGVLQVKLAKHEKAQPRKVQVDVE